MGCLCLIGFKIHTQAFVPSQYLASRRYYIYRKVNQLNVSGSGQVYLQVGSWVYPLIPGISPVFRADFGAFILPDVHSELEGAAVGLILPATADKSVYDLLNSILLGVVGGQDLPSREPRAPTR